VVVGAGQLNLTGDEAVGERTDPIRMMAEATRLAAADAGANSLIDKLTSVRIVNILSVRHPNPGRVLADELGVNPHDTALSPVGGNSPQSLVNHACIDLLTGSDEVILIAGCEPWRTRQSAQRSGQALPWIPADPDMKRARRTSPEMAMSHEAEIALGIGMPIQVYPIFETAIRAASGNSPEEHLTQIGELWSRFAEVAKSNPYAAEQGGFSAEEIITPSASNRWIGYPYTKWLVSNDRVDQSAALILTTVETANALGISSDRWVFPHTGTDTAEALVSQRDRLDHSPAIRIGGHRALELAEVDVDDIAHLDVYSCFPSAVQIAATELGLGLDRQLTVTGGLTFAGGPWNNYVTHSIATMVNKLREDAGSKGFITANGGLISKHAFGVYSTTPPTDNFRYEYPQDEVDAIPGREVSMDYEGPVNIEAYTVLHDRDLAPSQAILTTLNPEGERRWATSDDADTMAWLVANEGGGHSAVVRENSLHLNL